MTCTTSDNQHGKTLGTRVRSRGRLTIICGICLTFHGKKSSEWLLGLPEWMLLQSSVSQSCETSSVHLTLWEMSFLIAVIQHESSFQIFSINNWKQPADREILFQHFQIQFQWLYHVVHTRETSTLWKKRSESEVIKPYWQSLEDKYDFRRNDIA